MTLIERLEAATGPERELDAEIAAVVEAGMRHHWFASPPLFTSSIDAAMTLVPDGWDYSAGNRDETEKAWAWVAEEDDVRGEYWQTIQQSSAVTPALAICIASLKARGAKQ